jgi:hypothetical protein
VVNGVGRFSCLFAHTWIAAGVEVAIKTRKIAAAHFEPDSMAFQEYIARRPHIDPVFERLAWLDPPRLLS